MNRIKHAQQKRDNLIEKDPLLEMQYSSELLDKVADFMILKNQKQAEKTKLLEEQAKINSIKNAIFEKHIFNSEDEIVDFDFLQITVPYRNNIESIIIAFATNDKSTTTGNIKILGMRGEELLQKQIKNWEIQHILPNIHPHEVYLAVLCSITLDLHLITFSNEEFINKKKEATHTLDLRIINENSINLPEKLKDLNKENVTDTELVIEKASTYSIKGNKYFLFIDSKGRAITVRSDLKVKNIFPLETSSITSLKRHNLSLLFSTENNIGFLKIFEEISDQVFWEGGTAKITAIAGDYLSPSNLYAITEEVDQEQNTIHHLVIFEIKQASSKISAEECKIFGKIKLPQATNTTEYSLITLRGFVMVMDDQGVVQIFKTLNLNDLITSPVSYTFSPFKSLHTQTPVDSTGISEHKKALGVKNNDLREARSFQGTYVMMRNPQNLRQVIVSEYIKLHEVEETDWLGGSTIKVVLIAVALLLVVSWRWCKSAGEGTQPLTIDDMNEAEGMNAKFRRG